MKSLKSAANSAANNEGRKKNFDNVYIYMEVISEQVNVEGELPTLQQFSHSIKVEETAKGLRIHVHVYGNNEDKTIESALRTYIKTVARFKEGSHTMAPMNGGSV